MKYFLTLTLSIFLAGSVCSTTQAQTPAKKKSTQKIFAKKAPPAKTTIASLGATQIRFDELADMFQSSASRSGIGGASYDSVKSFLGIYLDFRLKLLDAYARGLDKDPEITAEIKGYRNSLAGPFLMDKILIEPTLRVMYERRKEELRVNHLLVRCAPNGSPADTLAAFTKAERLLGMIHAGAKFSALARDSSDDPQAKENYGDLGYFTAGMAQRSFEDAAYSMKTIGEVYPRPIRTLLGYHLIQLTERARRVDGVSASHILIKAEGTDTVRAYAKADSLLRLVKAGADFKRLATENSQDPGTAKKGGDLGFFSRQQMQRQFEFATYALADGEVSGIVRTRFGYHIIKRTGTHPVPSFDEDKDNLRTIYNNWYKTDDTKKFFEQLRRRYAAVVDNQGLGIFTSHVDSTRTTLDSSWSVRFSSSDKARTLFSVGKKGMVFTIGAFIDSLKTRQDLKGTTLNVSGVSEAITKILDPIVMGIETENLETRYPEFGSLMKLNLEGILSFKLEQKEVWDKLSTNEDSLRAFWAPRKGEYRFPDRVDYSTVLAPNDSVSRRIIHDMKDEDVTFDSLMKLYPNRTARSRDKWHAESEGDVARRALAMKVGEVSEPIAQEGGRYLFIRVNAKDPAREKTFEEAQSEIAGVYQDQMTQRLKTAWLSSLRHRFPVSIKEDTLRREWEHERTKLSMK